jgi:hypothetical protein
MAPLTEEARQVQVAFDVCFAFVNETEPPSYDEVHEAVMEAWPALEALQRTLNRRERQNAWLKERIGTLDAQVVELREALNFADLFIGASKSRIEMATEPLTDADCHQLLANLSAARSRIRAALSAAGEGT